MMDLEVNNVNSFLRSFYQCHDSILKSLSMEARGDSFNFTLTACIQCRHDRTLINSEWVDLYLEFEDIYSFNFVRKLGEDYRVMSNGIHILYEHGIFFTNLGGSSFDIEKIDDFKYSQMHLSSRAIRWRAVEV
ncbi:hypothetical protein [Deinococcus sonorensis]|uniref:Uncharacterized protein n=1 Tax=Deinococcus sonorensis TaxID=309891 RepID=A0ABV8YBI1_9DEIO